MADKKVTAPKGAPPKETKVAPKATPKGSPQSGPPPATFDGPTQYLVVLNEPVKHGGQWLRPGAPLQMRGDICERYREQIESVITETDVPPPPPEEEEPEA